MSKPWDHLCNTLFDDCGQMSHWTWKILCLRKSDFLYFINCFLLPWISVWAKWYWRVYAVLFTYTLDLFYTWIWILASIMTFLFWWKGQRVKNSDHLSEVFWQFEVVQRSFCLLSSDFVEPVSLQWVLGLSIGLSLNTCLSLFSPTSF